jgi:probable HAF family extracellular repeat protein
MNQTLFRQLYNQLVRQAFRLVVIGVCTRGTLAYAVVPSPQYQLVILPPLPGNSSSIAADISNSNVIVGSTTSSSDAQSVKWTNNVPSLIRPGNSIAYAINDAGDIVGSTIGGGGSSNGYLLKGTTLTEIHPGPGNSVALDVNNSDQVVGLVEPSGNTSAYLWHDGVTVLLGTLGGKQSRAFTINNLGQVGGYAETPNLSGRAFIWTDTNRNDISDPGEMKQLSDMGLSSAVNSINDLGQAVGFVLNSNFLRQPVIWNNTTTFTPLPNPSGQPDSEPFAISLNGDIVGTSHGRAILWHGGQVYDLNNLVSPVSGYSMLRATGINDKGLIVGQGLLGNADTGFMLIPVPEPSSLTTAIWLAIIFSGSLRRPPLN